MFHLTSSTVQFKAGMSSQPILGLSEKNICYDINRFPSCYNTRLKINI